MNVNDLKIEEIEKIQEIKIERVESPKTMPKEESCAMLVNDLARIS